MGMREWLSDPNSSIIKNGKWEKKKIGVEPNHRPQGKQNFLRNKKETATPTPDHPRPNKKKKK